jgi:hypothetical protein
MNMKKRSLLIVIVICLVVVLAVVGLFFFRPMPLIASPNTVVNGSEEYSKSDTVVDRIYYNSTDVTDRIDIEQFVKILGGYKCKRTFNNPFPYASEDMVWEINLIQNFKPIHIVLGKDSVRYEAVNTGMYRIINPESLMDELNTIIQR